MSQRIKVGHVEAGLRTGDLHQPWPEEMNRSVIDRFAERESARIPLPASAIGLPSGAASTLIAMDWVAAGSTLWPGSPIRPLPLERANTWSSPLERVRW